MPPLSQTDRRKSITAAIACVSAYAITATMTTPLLSLILEQRGESRTIIGLLSATGALAILLVTPLMPAMIRKMGIRTFLLTCLGGEFTCFLLFPLLDWLPAWFLLRIVMGIGGGGLFVASEIWINAVAEDATRGRVLGVYSSVLAAGLILGPFLLAFLGTSSALPFLAGAFLVALAAVPIIWTRQLMPILPGRATFNVLSFLAVAPVIAGAVTLNALRETTGMSLLPVYGFRLGLSEAQAAAALSATYVGAFLFQVPIGWMSDRVGHMRVLIACAFGVLLGAALLPWLMESGIVVLWMGLILWGGIGTGMYTVAMISLGHRFKGANLVTANASINMLFGLGGLLGPLITGAAMDVWDPGGFPGVIFFSSLIFLVIAAVFRGR